MTLCFVFVIPQHRHSPSQTSGHTQDTLTLRCSHRVTRDPTAPFFSFLIFFRCKPISSRSLLRQPTRQNTHKTQTHSRMYDLAHTHTHTHPSQWQANTSQQCHRIETIQFFNAHMLAACQPNLPKSTNLYLSIDDDTRPP